MALIREVRRRATQLIVPAIGACLVIYFAYYTVDGGRGLKAMRRLQGESAVAEARLDLLQTQREGLEKQDSRLRPDSIDPDLLEERARVVLNFSKPNDLVIKQDAKK